MDEISFDEQAKELTKKLWDAIINSEDYQDMIESLSGTIDFVGNQTENVYKMFSRLTKKVITFKSDIKADCFSTFCKTSGHLLLDAYTFEEDVKVKFEYNALFLKNNEVISLVDFNATYDDDFLQVIKKAKLLKRINSQSIAIDNYEDELSKALYYKNAFETENDLTYEVDVLTHSVCVDKERLVKVYDIKPQELEKIDPHYLIIGAIHEMDRNKYSNWWHASFRGTEEEKRAVRAIEYRAMTPSGDYKWFKSTVTPVVNRKNQIVKIIGRVKDIDERKSREQYMHNLTTIDSLTGLTNRRCTEIKIDRYINEEKGYGALLMIDIDDFKQVNDQYGHMVGDQTLLKFASILRGACSEKDIIGRIGGDEFVVFLRKTDSKKAIIDKAEQIINSINQGIYESNDMFKATASIGIAVYPNHGKRFTILWTNADKALYRIKNSGKNTYSFYDEKID